MHEHYYYYFNAYENGFNLDDIIYFEVSDL
jgi:hypothetical protein